MTGRGPTRSSRFPASGDIKVMTTRITEPPIDTKVRPQPSSCSQVGMINPSVERAENTTLSDANINATISQPRELARTIELKEGERSDIGYRLARADNKFTSQIIPQHGDQRLIRRRHRVVAKPHRHDPFDRLAFHRRHRSGPLAADVKRH